MRKLGDRIWVRLGAFLEYWGHFGLLPIIGKNAFNYTGKFSIEARELEIIGTASFMSLAEIPPNECHLLCRAYFGIKLETSSEVVSRRQRFCWLYPVGKT